MGGTGRLALGGAGLLGATGMALGAVAAHGSALDPAHAAILRRGVEVAMWHAAALAGLAGVARGRLLAGAIVAMLAGGALFAVAVDLAAFGVTAVVWGAPVGGTLLIVSWVAVAAAALRGG